MSFDSLMLLQGFQAMADAFIVIRAVTFLLQVLWAIVLIAMLIKKADRAALILSIITILAGAFATFISWGWMKTTYTFGLEGFIYEFFSIGGGTAIVTGLITLIICIIKLTRKRRT